MARPKKPRKKYVWKRGEIYEVVGEQPAPTKIDMRLAKNRPWRPSTRKEKPKPPNRPAGPLGNNLCSCKVHFIWFKSKQGLCYWCDPQGKSKDVKIYQKISKGP